MTPIQKTFIESLFNSSDKIAYCEISKDSVISNNQIVSIKTLLNLKWSNGASVGINPLKPGETRRNKTNIKTYNAIVIDIDKGKIPLNIPVKPHYVFSRSKSNHHLYFLLKRGKRSDSNDKLYTQTAQAIIDFCGGDVAVKDLARVIRLPLCPHPSGSQYKLINHLKKNRYSLKELKKSFLSKNIEPDSVFDVTINGQDENPPGKKKKSKLVDRHLKIIFDHFSERGPIEKGEGRSRIILQVGFDCYMWGIDKLEALKLSRKINEAICNPPEKESVLKHQIESAYKYSNQDFGILLNTVKQENAQGRQRVYKKFTDNQKIRAALHSWVYIANADRLVSTDISLELTTGQQIENYVAHISGTRATIKTILSEKLIEVCEFMDFIPDNDDRIIIDKKSKDNIQKIFNRYEIIKTKTEGNINKKVVKLFEDHIKFLTTSDYEFKAVLNFLSYIVQNPGKKLPYALLIISKYEGIGKSILELLYKNIFTTFSGKCYVDSVANEQLTKGWTHYLVDKLICFVHELAQKEKYSSMNRFKNLITEPTVEIDAKFSRQYTIKNTTNFIMFSNNADALKISPKDRRLLVIYNDKKPQKSNYYKRLVKIFNENFSDIYRHQLKRNLSKFDPFERHQITIGKKQLIEQSENELDLFLADALNSHQGPFANKLFSAQEVLIFSEQEGPNSIRTSIKTVRNFLISGEFESVHLQKRIKKQRVNKVLWGLKENFTEKNIDKYFHPF